MALIACIECGKIFSDKATACPMCACPTNYSLSGSQDVDTQLRENNILSETDDYEIVDNVIKKYLGNAECIQLPFGIRGIDKAAFRGCKSIKTVVLPKSIEFISEQAFESCVNLIEINIPPLVKSIFSHTFRNCNALSSIILPEGLEKIAANAFSQCYNLNELLLPSTIIYISLYAFNYCNVEKILYNGNCRDFDKLTRQHTHLYGLYHIGCKDGILNYFDKTNCTAQLANNNSIAYDELQKCYCELCGKQFVPSLQHVYTDEEEFYNTKEYYCSWTCYRQRDNECCPVCGKNFLIHRNEKGERNGDCDEDGVYYCSWTCLDEALDRSDDEFI